MNRKFFFSVLLVLIFVFIGQPASAAGVLIKADNNPAVYYLDEQNTRHIFPTENTYQSWYSDFSGIEVWSAAKISEYPLGKNITARPGVSLVKFESLLDVYAVSPGGILRPLADAKIAAGIFGSDWPAKQLTLPDAFFSDYQLGATIKDAYDLPDGLVYKSTVNNKYYLKTGGIIWPFKDLKSVLANNFQKFDIMVSASQFNSRQREITGFDERVFNPLAAPANITNDCEHQNFKVAFILAAKDKYSQEELDKVNAIKNKLADTFAWATNGLAKIDASYPLVVENKDSYLFSRDSDGQLKPDNEVVNTFFDSHPDEFDFVVLYNNFVQNEPVIARYIPVTNDFIGTGNTQMHMAQSWGSNGKLKAVINMGNLDKYNINIADGLDLAENYLIHEIGHHFTARAKFRNADGNVSNDLLRFPDLEHWNRYVDFISPLGGNGWQDLGDGTFQSKITLANEPSKKKFSDLDLYFMGLLPAPYAPPVKYLAPKNPAAADSNIVAGALKTVTISQIISAMGEWSCHVY